MERGRLENEMSQENARSLDEHVLGGLHEITF